LEIPLKAGEEVINLLRWRAHSLCLQRRRSWSCKNQEERRAEERFLGEERRKEGGVDNYVRTITDHHAEAGPTAKTTTSP
jgi:hypothetical protein